MVSNFKSLRQTDETNLFVALFASMFNNFHKTCLTAKITHRFVMLLNKHTMTLQQNMKRTN